MPSLLACFRCGQPVESNAGSRSECSQRKISAAVDKVVSLKKHVAGGFGDTAAASLGRSVSVASCGYPDEYTDCEASGQEDGCGHTRSHLSCSSTADHASRTTCGLSRGSSSTAAAQPPEGALPAAGIRSHLPSTRSHGRGRRMRNGRMGSARSSSHTHRHSSTPPTAAEAAAATSEAPVDGSVILPLTAEQMAMGLKASARPAAQAAATDVTVPELHASTHPAHRVGTVHRESRGDRGSGGSRASAGRGRGSSCGSEPPTDFPTTGSAGERSSGGSSAPPASCLAKTEAEEVEEDAVSAAGCDGRRLLGCSEGLLQETPQLPPTAQEHPQDQLIHQHPVDPLAFRFEPSALATLHHGWRSMDVPLHSTHEHEQQQPGHLQHSSSMPYGAAPWPFTTSYAAPHGPLPRSPLGPCWGPSPAPASASPGHTGSPAQRYMPSSRSEVLPPAPSLPNQTHAGGSFTGGHPSHIMTRLAATTSMGHSHSLTERCGSISRQRAGAWAIPPASSYHSEARSHQQHLSPGLLRCGSCSSNTGAAPPVPPSPHNGTGPKTSVLLSKGLINTAASHMVRQRSAGAAPAGASPGTCGLEDSPASVTVLGRPLQRPQLPGRIVAPEGPAGTRHRRSSLADAYGRPYGVPYGHVAGHGDARPEVMLVLEGGHGDGRCGRSVGTVPRDDLMYDLYDMRRQDLEQHNQMVQVHRHQQQNQSLREAFGHIRRAGSLTAGRVRTAAAGGGGGGVGWGPSPSAQERERSGGRQGPGSAVRQQQQQQRVPGHRLWRARRASCSSVVEVSQWY